MTADTSPSQPRTLRAALAERLVIADGAMGSMLQGCPTTLDDFAGHEGCNEILNVTRPDIVRAIHDGYLEAGVDCITTNTFGANLGNLGEYGIAERIEELAEAGARLARQAADDWPGRDRAVWVLGSIGPGTKLPTLGHVTFAELRDTYQANAAGLLRGGADALIVETCQDLLQAKAAIIGARRAIAAATAQSGADIMLIAQVTIETTGAMLLGSEIGAALTALEPLGIDLIGLNCATGPAEMSEHLRYLAAHSPVPLSCMPNAGLPELTSDGAYYPVTPAELADAHEAFAREFGLALAGGCCGTTPEHMAEVVRRLRDRPLTAREPRLEPGVASLYQHVPFRQDTAFLAIGERTNANGSKAFREAMVAERYDDCVEIARAQTRDGAHLLDVCVDYVGRDGASDMRQVAGRLATAATLPLVLDSTEPEVIRAGLELLGGRAVVNSVNYEDGDGPGSRIARVMPLVREHGAAVIALTIDEQGQARTAEWKLAVATRLIEDLTGHWGMRRSDIIVDCLTFPIATGQEETRRDAIETIDAIRELKRRYPEVQTTLGVSNVSFGLNPAARAVLNSVFLAECTAAGLDSAIVHASRIMPISRIPEDQLQAALDLVYDRRREGYDPLARLLELFEGVDAAAVKASRAAELAGLPLWERLKRRIIDGEKIGLEADLDEAPGQRPALEIVNDVLLDGMKTVGELFGSGQMQLPVRAAVGRGHEGGRRLPGTAHGALRRGGQGQDRAGHGQGRRPRHRQEPRRHHPVEQRLRRGQHRHQAADLRDRGGRGLQRGRRHRHVRPAGEVHRRDAGQPGRAELAAPGRPVAGAARRRRPDPGVRGAGPGRPVRGRGPLRPRRVRGTAADGRVHGGQARGGGRAAAGAARAAGAGRPAAAGHRARGHARPLRRGRGQPGAGPRRSSATGSSRASSSPTTRPSWTSAPRSWASGASSRPAARAGRPTRSSSRPKGDRGCGCGWSASRPRACWTPGSCTATSRPSARATTWWCWTRTGTSASGSPSRGSAATGTCAWPTSSGPRESGETDVVGFQLVTVGAKISEATAELFAKNAYRDYLELHGLSVQLAEALAEYWHGRVRDELGIGGEDPVDLDGILKVRYRGCRYSFGYPACPDLEDRAKVMRLLDPERIGVTLSEEFQLAPEQSTDALITHHPEASYFST